MTKQCVICNQPIIENKERWVRLTDFDCGKQVGEVYNHLECWMERFQITNSERKKIMYSKVAMAINNIKNNMNKGGMVISQ